MWKWLRPKIKLTREQKLELEKVQQEVYYKESLELAKEQARKQAQDDYE